MGHERIGALPKSKQWRQVVQGLSTLATHPARIDSVAVDTLGLVKDRFRALQNEPAVQGAFAFLVRVAVASRKGELPALVGSAKRQSEVAPIVVAIALKRSVANLGGNQERASLSEDAAVDALVKWHSSHGTALQETLFGGELAGDTWSILGNGAGFCELSRLYFASLSERYLSYYLEREVATALGTLQARQDVQRDLRKHVESVSKHAFETALITQSFAAGWFNANAAAGMPTDEQVNGFVAHAIGKMRGELNREALKI